MGFGGVSIGGRTFRGPAADIGRPLRLNPEVPPPPDVRPGVRRGPPGGAWRYPTRRGLLKRHGDRGGPPPKGIHFCPPPPLLPASEAGKRLRSPQPSPPSDSSIRDVSLGTRPQSWELAGPSRPSARGGRLRPPGCPSRFFAWPGSWRDLLDCPHTSGPGCPSERPFSRQNVELGGSPPWRVGRGFSSECVRHELHVFELDLGEGVKAV